MGSEAAAKAHGDGNGEGNLREERIRDELESNAFQNDLAKDSKGEKVEEIPRIISPLSIRPETERSGRILEGNGGGAKLGFRAAAAGG